ncbi:hypothetical protein NA57DRAFT_58355 [Rhizodiscina lignyota]|uniref:Uncharacterized protein n=1 Tax=Rhizodiscina lignyota TaxID=1504668 RepID=A0A9P4I7I2_9PEZI|nr:hypothetical protein NA57DRAFT_58355 [Rhizodiscina lignyota]
MDAPEPNSRSSIIRNTCHSFCQSLIHSPNPPQLIDQHFSLSPSITEHGPIWANERLPFLGKTFTTKDGCLEYFDVLSKTLTMDMSPKSFPKPEDFIVNAFATTHEGARQGVVSVVGAATFRSVKTGKSWDEKFIYRLSDFDGEGKIGHWEIWADPLSAWEAVGD